jgi:hypothetical protein
LPLKQTPFDMDRNCPIKNTKLVTMKKLSRKERQAVRGGWNPIPGCTGDCYYYSGGTLINSFCGVGKNPFGPGQACVCIGSGLLCYIPPPGDV